MVIFFNKEKKKTGFLAVSNKKTCNTGGIGLVVLT